jgi:predicted lipoprotein with Yx(FWY)xxD motif
MRTRFRWAPLTVALVIGMAAVACGGTPTSSTSPPPASPAPKPVVKTKTATVAGKSETVLADAQKGLTLYYFTPDQGGKVTCTAQCAAAWPPLMLPSGVSKPTGSGGITGTLGTLSTPNGTQVTYNGWPLYTYAKDADAGDVYGQGVGGKWFVAALNIPAATEGSPTPGGSGY